MIAMNSPADYQRRRQHFLGDPKSSGDPILNDLPDIAPSRVDASDPLEQAATGLVRSSLESHALSMQMPLVGADMDRMLSAAQYLLRGMPRHQLAGLSPSSSIMQSLTTASFSIAMAPDMQQRAMRMAHEKAALASQAAAVDDQARTGGVVAFGYQRPGGRGRDDDARSGSGRSSLGGLGGLGMGFDANSIRFAGLGNERVTPAVARVMQMASHEAVRTGIPWAVSKPDLLKQGPAGVKAVADVQIKEPTYQRLTTQAHFAAKEVVTLATFAKVKGIADSNPLAHATADVVQIGRTIPEQINTKNAITGYMAASTAVAAKPNDPAAQAALEKAGMHQRDTLIPIAASSPENYQKVQSYEDKAKVEKRFRATMTEMEAKAELAKTQAAQAEATATATRAAAAQKANASDTMFGLPSTPAAGPGASPTGPAPSPLTNAGGAAAMLPNPALSAQPSTQVAAALPPAALVSAPATPPVTGPHEATAANSARPAALNSDTTVAVAQAVTAAVTAGVATTATPTASSATAPAHVVASTASPPSAPGIDAATPTATAAQSVPSPSTQVAVATAPAAPAPAAPATPAATPANEAPAATAPAVQTASVAPVPKAAAGPKPG
jgi:hypothetical protein